MNEISVYGEGILSRKETYGKARQTKSVPVFTTRMERREYYKGVNLFDIRNVLDVTGLLKDIRENLHTYVSLVNTWIQRNPVKKLVVTGIFTVILGFFATTGNAAFINEYTYQVKSGEKIETIAAAHGVTAQEILDANGLSSIDGKKILLPKVQDKTVTATILNVRSQPNTKSSIIGTFKKGEVVKVSFVENGWAGILIKGRVCFVSAEYLTEAQTISPTPVSQAKTMVVTATSLRVREAASTNSAIVGSLKLNDQVTVISTVKGWGKINYNGKEAFVSETYLTTKEPVQSSSSYYVIKSGDTFTKIAKSFGISVASIQKQNPGVEPTKLKIGQQIKIPATAKPIPNELKVVAQISGVDSKGTFRFITSDGSTYAAKATGNMVNELYNHQGKNVTLTLEGKRGQQLTLVSLQ